MKFKQLFEIYGFIRSHYSKDGGLSKIWNILQSPIGDLIFEVNYWDSSVDEGL